MLFLCVSRVFIVCCVHLLFSLCVDVFAGRVVVLDVPVVVCSCPRESVFSIVICFVCVRYRCLCVRVVCMSFRKVLLRCV